MTLINDPSANFNNPAELTSELAPPVELPSDVQTGEPVELEVPDEKSHRRALLAGSIALTTALAGGLFLSQQGDAPEQRPTAVEQTPEPTPAPQPTELTPSVSPTSVETTPAVQGTEILFNPNSPELTKSTVLSLYQNIETAINSNDPELLLYAGIPPKSQLGLSITEAMNYYYDVMKKNGDIGSFSFRLTENNIKIDTEDPTKVTIQTSSLTDYLNRINSVKYTRLELIVRHRPIILPDGSTKDIYIVAESNPTDITREEFIGGLE